MADLTPALRNLVREGALTVQQARGMMAVVPPGRPRGKFGPGARKAIKLSREMGIKEGIQIGLARARAANVGSARHV